MLNKNTHEGEGYSDLDKRGCITQALKPLPISKGHFDRNKYPYFRDFSRNIWSIFQNFQVSQNFFEKRIHVWGYFCRKWDPCLGISCEKATHWSGTSLCVLICETSPPPPAKHSELVNGSKTDIGLGLLFKSVGGRVYRGILSPLVRSHLPIIPSHPVEPLNKLKLDMWCCTSKGDFAGEDIDVLELFLSFKSKWHIIYQNWSRHSNYTIEKGWKILTVLLIIFLESSQLRSLPPPFQFATSHTGSTEESFSWMCHLYALPVKRLTNLPPPPPHTPSLFTKAYFSKCATHICKEIKIF